MLINLVNYESQKSVTKCPVLPLKWVSIRSTSNFEVTNCTDSPGFEKRKSFLNLLEHRFDLEYLDTRESSKFDRLGN